MSFKVDLITIFPGIVLETEKYTWGKTVPDPNLFSFLKHRKTQIHSYSYLNSHQRIINRRFRKYIEEVRSKIKDSDTNDLRDFTIILDRDVEKETLLSTNTDTQEFLTFIAYDQNIDFWINLDFIRILCFKKNGREIFLNNQRENYFPKQIYTLPIVQDGLHKIRIGNNEKGLLKILTILKTGNKRQYERILTSISLYNQANRLHFFDKKSAVVLIVSAFEALLELPRRPKKETFVFGIKTFLGFNEHVEKWAGELYDLRSEIVHGEVVDGEKLLIGEYKHMPHFGIAKESYMPCLYQILERSRIARINHNFIIERGSEIIKKIIPNKKKVEKILDSKGKFSYPAFKKNKRLYKEFILRVETLTHTDYSAFREILKLIKVIVSIAIDWSKGNRQVLRTLNRKDLKSYKTYQLNLLKELDKTFLKINFKWLKLDRYNDKRFLEEKIREVLEIARKMDPVVHPKDKFDVSLPEFLDRVLGSLWGTY